jgi:hypothetical protein
MLAELCTLTRCKKFYGHGAIDLLQLRNELVDFLHAVGTAETEHDSL